MQSCNNRDTREHAYDREAGLCSGSDRQRPRGISTDISSINKFSKNIVVPVIIYSLVKRVQPGEIRFEALKGTSFQIRVISHQRTVFRRIGSSSNEDCSILLISKDCAPSVIKIQIQ